MFARGLLFFAAAIVGALLALGDVGEAAAATFTVNSEADVPDFAPGNGICRTSFVNPLVPGTCTLRAAIQEANARPGVDTINVPSGRFNLFQNPTGSFPRAEDITDSVVIVGVGSGATTINLGPDNTNIWTVQNNATAHVIGRTVTGGKGIQIDTGATGVVTSSTLDNSSLANILNGGTLTVQNSSIVNARSAGGIFNGNGGVLLVDSSVIQGNTASVGSQLAAGILNAGTATVTNSLIANNVSTLADGIGGIHSSGGNLAVFNSTISGNRGLLAGGILMVRGTHALLNVTIANNIGIGFRVAPDLTGAAPSSIGTVQNVLLSNNAPVNSSGFVQVNPNPQFQQNLDSGNTCLFPAVTNLSGVNPFIADLADNGGPTRTHALRPGSPAIDSAFCTGFFQVATDRRGSPRPIDGNGDGFTLCDIGAFERQGGVGFGGVGVGTVTPRDATAAVGEVFTHVLNWDVPGPESWNALSTVQYRLRTDGKVVFWVRWDQTTNLFQLLDANGDPVGPPVAGGTPSEIGNGDVTLDLGKLNGRGSGPSGLRATLTLPLVFAESLLGKVLTVDMSGSNDFGAVDPFRGVGTIRVAGSVAQTTNPKNEDEDDEKPKETEEQRQQRQHTNAGHRGDVTIEGNVVAVEKAADGKSLLVTIALTRSETQVVQVPCFGDGTCYDIRAVDYLEADGYQNGVGDPNDWFVAADGVEVTRNGRKVK
jgi:CSLREA domain-containing protein